MIKKDDWYKIVPITISIISLLISLQSYFLSKDNKIKLEQEKQPKYVYSIVETIDEFSYEITFENIGGIAKKPKYTIDSFINVKYNKKEYLFETGYFIETKEDKDDVFSLEYSDNNYNKYFKEFIDDDFRMENDVFILTISYFDYKNELNHLYYLINNSNYFGDVEIKPLNKNELDSLYTKVTNTKSVAAFPSGIDDEIISELKEEIKQNK